MTTAERGTNKALGQQALKAHSQSEKVSHPKGEKAEGGERTGEGRAEDEHC